VPPSGGVAGVPFYPRVAKYLWALGNLYTGEVERAELAMLARVWV